MALHILPVVGSSGFYDLAPPFHSFAENNVRYTCMAVRRISDYLSNNEEPKESIYDEYGISDQYEIDVVENAYIVSLQSSNGHWLYVPYRYINSYPSTDGVPYRSTMLAISLPAMPIAHEFTDLEAEIKDLILARLGVDCVIKQVETSQPSQVPTESHETSQQSRLQRMTESTIYVSMARLEADNTALRAKLAQLENYIKTHLP